MLTMSRKQLALRDNGQSELPERPTLRFRTLVWLAVLACSMLAGTVLAPPGLGSEEEVQIVITISFDGTVTGGYSAAGGSVSFRDVTGALSAKATATFAGQTTDVTTPQLASLPIASGAASTYRCDGASLSLTPTVPNAMTMHFVRV